MSAVAWAVAGLTAVAMVARPVSGGLIADWQFEGNVLDATGNYNATALNSPTYATGMIGQAFQPDGGTTELNMGNTYTTVTVSAWIQTYDANSPGSQAIFHNTRWDTGTPHFLLEWGGGSPSLATTGLVIGVNSSGEVNSTMLRARSTKTPGITSPTPTTRRPADCGSTSTVRRPAMLPSTAA